MDFYYFLFCLGTLGIGALTFAEDISKKIKQISIINSLVFKIPVFILCSLLIFLSQYMMTKEEKENQGEVIAEYQIMLKERDAKYVLEQKKSDSVFELKSKTIIDSIYQRSLKASNNALGKYNLILTDSLQKVAKVLTEKKSLAQLSLAASSKEETPTAYMINVNGEDFLNFKLISNGGTCYRISLNVYFLQKNGNDVYLVHQTSDKTNDQFLVPDRFRTVSIKVVPAIKDKEKIYVVLIGSFSRDPMGEEIIPYKEMFAFDFKNKGIVTYELMNLTEIENVLRSNGKL